MRRNQVISKRKLISNIVGWPDYYISKRSRLYRYYPKRKVCMLLKGTLNRGRIYHILRDSNKDYLNGVTIKELKQKYNITHIHRYVKETKKRYRLGHDRVRELIRDKAKGYSNKELGEKYKLSKASISHYLNRSL